MPDASDIWKKSKSFTAKTNGEVSESYLDYQHASWVIFTEYWPNFHKILLAGTRSKIKMP